MAKKHHPKRGSKQFWPRKRASKPTAKVGSWDSKILPKEVNLLGFPAYKVGMTHIGVIDNFSHSLTKGTEVCYPVTILETPPIRVLSFKLYKKDSLNNLQIYKEYVAKIKDKNLQRRITMAKKKVNLPTLDKIKQILEKEQIEEIRLKVYTNPSSTTIGKKKPEILEIGLSGSLEEKLEFAYNKLGQKIKVSEVFKGGELLDSHGVTKGKGFQGAVKRFGVKLTAHKSEKKRRHAGNVGAWTPSRVLTTIPLPGQTGYHLRTEYNKWLIKVSDDPELINPKSGFKGYGLVKNEYLLIKGSVQGPRKRLITLVRSIRPNPKYPKIAPEVTYINK